MNIRLQALALSLLAATSFGAAQAVTVHVNMTGTVDYSFLGGALTNVPDGAPASMDFDVDSTDYVDGVSFPTRGYRIDLSTFSLVIGGVALTLDNPQSADPFFVLRNNDPAVDGFLMSQGNVEFPFSLTMHIPGLSQVYDFDFLRTFNTDTTFSSLDILDAVGSYGFENMSSYQWTISRFGNPFTEIAYQTITLTVPEPAAALLFGLGGLALAARRRLQPAG